MTIKWRDAIINKKKVRKCNIMKRGDIITYAEMAAEEGFAIQRGMNFNVNNKDYGIVLMSVRKNAPYADRFEDDQTTIIYEGHDMQSNHVAPGKVPKEVDQPTFTPSNKLTENGKFLYSVMRYKKGEKPKKIKVYEKIKSGIWVYNGFFNLTDAWLEESNNRNVFKFKLVMIEDVADGVISEQEDFDIAHNRLIPTEVKVQVWKRDKGRCVYCNSDINLHFDHIIPFSKGGASITVENIQLLCAKCNLKKHANIE